MNKVILAKFSSLIVMLWFFSIFKCDAGVDSSLLNADVSFMIIDAKYSENNLKVLEFGVGQHSGFKHYDTMFGEGAIYAKFWRYLSEFKKPMWFVDPLVSRSLSAKMRNGVKRRRALDVFKNKGGIVVPSIFALEKLGSFKNAKKSKGSPRSISSCKGLVVLKRPGNRWFCMCSGVKGKKKCNLCKESDAFCRFKKKHPNFLYVTESGFLAGEYKAYALSLFDDLNKTQFKPQGVLCPKKYSQENVKRVLDAVRSDKLVLKPVDSSRGRGVIMISRNDFDHALKLICSSPEKLKAFDATAWKQWAKDKNQELIVESLESSKKVVKSGRGYDPTLRVAFVLFHNKGNVGIKFLDMYWKLPLFSLDDNVSLTDRYKSKHAESIKVAPSATLSKREKLDVKRLMRKFIFQLYGKMLSDLQ